MNSGLLFQTLVEIYPEARALQRAGVSLPRICEQTALYMFTYKPELCVSEGAMTIRYQLKRLWEKGEFEFYE
jgi:hypothetical protein